jgi:hypothetical protein
VKRTVYPTVPAKSRVRAYTGGEVFDRAVERPRCVGAKEPASHSGGESVEQETGNGSVSTSQRVRRDGARYSLSEQAGQTRQVPGDVLSRIHCHHNYLLSQTTARP